MRSAAVCTSRRNCEEQFKHRFIRIHSATSDNEAATKLTIDLLLTTMGTVRCVLHTLA